MRCFLGLPVPAPLRQQLAQWCAAASTEAAKPEEMPAPEEQTRWEHHDDWHLTVAFLGHTDAGTMARLASAMERICAEAAVIRQPLAAPARFPTASGPLLVLEGEAVPALVALRTAVAPVCLQLGLPWEPRAFRPHVTLARQYPSGRALPPLPEPVMLPANELVLYRSEPPDAAGRRYRIHARWALGQS